VSGAPDVSAVPSPSAPPPGGRRPLVRTTLLLAPLQLALRLGEAAFPLFLAAWFGSTAETDVYVFAATVFTLAGALVFSAYRDSAIVPIVTELRLRRPGELPPVLGSLVVYTALASAVCAALVGSAAGAWFLVRYPQPLRGLALAMVAPLCLHLVLMAMTFLLVALLNAVHRFAAAPLAAAAGMGTTLLVLAAVRGPLGVAGIAWAQVAGELVGLLLLAALALRVTGLRFRLTTARPEPVRRFAALMLSHVGGQAITRMNPLVDQLFAGFVAVAGGATALKLAGDVAGAPTSLVQAALLPVLLSHLSEDFTRGERARFAATVRRSLLVLVPLLALVSAAMILLRRPLLELVYLRGAITPADIARMAPVLVACAVGLAPFGALLVLARAHVAAGNTRIMVSMGALNAGCNLALNAALAGPLGLPGIALATSITNLIVAVVFWVRLRPRLAPGAGAAPSPGAATGC
jgi:putative peptidoglycan lipid II flippase